MATAIIANAHKVSETEFNYDAELNCFWYAVPVAALTPGLLGYFTYKVAQSSKYAAFEGDLILFGVPDVATPTCRVVEKLSKAGRIYAVYSSVHEASTPAQRMALAAINKQALKAAAPTVVTPTTTSPLVDMTNADL
jgi:hypothetical protein